MIATVAAASLLAAGVAAPAAAVAPATAPAAVTAKSDCGYHPKTTVNLRSGPGTQYASLGLLAPDDRLDVTKERHGWYRVELVVFKNRSTYGLKDGKRGWVAKKHIRAATCMQLD